jgi:hypothetical protein
VLFDTALLVDHPRTKQNSPPSVVVGWKTGKMKSRPLCANMSPWQPNLIATRLIVKSNAWPSMDRSTDERGWQAILQMQRPAV